MRRGLVGLLGLVLLVPVSCGTSKDDGGALGDAAVAACPATPARPVDHEADVPFRRDLAVETTSDPLQLRLRVVDVDGCVPLTGLTVEVWHARPGGGGLLSGAQRTNDAGLVTFRTVYPGPPTQVAVRILDGAKVVLATELFPDGAPTPGLALEVGPRAQDGSRLATAVLGIAR